MVETVEVKTDATLTMGAMEDLCDNSEFILRVNILTPAESADVEVSDFESGRNLLV